MEQAPFSPLYVIKGKNLPHGSKEVLRHYNYCSDPKLGPGIVKIRIIPYNCHSCTTILFLSLDWKTKETVNQPRHGQVYYCKNLKLLGVTITDYNKFFWW